MDHKRWQQIKELFNEALDLQPEQRPVFIEKIRADSNTLAEEVESLIASHESTGTLSDQAGSMDQTTIPMETQAPELGPGDQLGPYLLEREIGKGGMGSVFFARRTDGFEQDVAIKLVQESHPRRFLLQRFLAERQILARLNHPHIARLLDGGTSRNGVPYLVMEHIDGLPIDRYCDEHRLSVDQRLRLLIDLCSAVHYAHQNLVVHRDLKPNNILVTPDGVPKLLDFGIAKWLKPDQDPHATETRGTQAPMTPRFASPEQFLNEPARTASDVYSLAVLAYHLLTGKGPYDLGGSTLRELASAVCTQQPIKPSERIIRNPPRDGFPESSTELAKRLRGDLDCILLRALEKDPDQRYSSARALGDDIQRHLHGLPVQARGDNFTYITTKWIRRRRGWVAAAALLLLSLIGGGLSTVHQARIAAREHDRAERRFNEVRDLSLSFLFDFHDKVVPLEGSTEARELVVKTALDYLSRLAQESEDDPELRLELARAYVRIGDIQGRLGRASLGDSTAAMASYRLALGLLERLEQGQVEDEAQRLDTLARCLERVGDQEFVRGRLSEALGFYLESRTVRASLVELRPDDLEARLKWTFTYDRIAEAQENQHQLDQALANYQHSRSVRQELLEKHPDNHNVLSNLSTSHFVIGSVLEKMGRPKEAYASFRNALKLDRVLLAAHPAHVELRYGLMSSLNRIGRLDMAMGRIDQALDLFFEGRAIAAEQNAKDPRDARARKGLAEMELRIAEAELAGGDPRKALSHGRPGLEMMKGLADQDPENVRLQETLAKAYLQLGLIRIRLAELDLGSVDQAEQVLRRGLAVLNGLPRLSVDDQEIKARILDLLPDSEEP